MGCFRALRDADDEDDDFSAVALLEHSVLLERCIPAWAWLVTMLLGLLMVALSGAGFALLLLGTNSVVAIFLIPFALLCFGLIIPVSQMGDHLNDVHTWLRRARRKRYCPMCRYDIRHLSSERCPECGFDFSILKRAETPV